MSPIHVRTLILFVCLPLCLCADAIDRAWQTSIAPVTLSLRNKLANDPYPVKFLVQSWGADSKWVYKTVSKPNAWQQPRFPRDFEGPRVDHLKPCVYTWQAFVGEGADKRVLDGQFTYPNGSLMQQSPQAAQTEAPGMLVVEFDALFVDRYAIRMILYPVQQQGGPFYTCRANITITDTVSGDRGLLTSHFFSIPIALLQPYVERIEEPDYEERIRPGIHRVLLKMTDFSHSIPDANDYQFDFDRGFAFADLDQDGRMELFVAEHMAAQRMRTGYAVYALEELGKGDWVELEPINDPALQDLDSESILNLSKKTVKNHSSGSAYDSKSRTYQLLPLSLEKTSIPFVEREQYHLIKVTGATIEAAPTGHYIDIEQEYSYIRDRDGKWERRVVSDKKLAKRFD